MDVEKAAQVCARVVESGNSIWIIGNGGSAAMASHFAGELVASGYKAAALTDVATITAIANDFSYDEVFYRQLHSVARPKDLVIALTTSGRSRNILRAALATLEIGCYWIQTETGDDTQAVQESHLKWLHSTWKRLLELTNGE